jgi:tRNA A-37 threonylcarbamoyl transferase component Bud32/tetratricopeptide (TPR) repeat protein
MPSQARDSAADAATGLAQTVDGGAAMPSPARAEPTSPAPVDWDRYEVFGLLGRGGMGAVYKARDRRLGRIVALKFIRGDDPLLSQRLLQEARAQARIEHDHICKVYEVGEIAGHAYIAMQYIAGPSLFSAQRELSLDQKVELLATITDAIQAAHRLGIIHRDLKPANVLLERGEDGRYRPYVMDFGLAHDSSLVSGLTQSGALLGTPQYMPPEQARGETRSIDRRSDVYSLGAVLYELVTGEPPFVGGSLADVLLHVLDREPVAPRTIRGDVPADLETIALKCLQKNPAARYESARALGEDLRRYLNGESILARRTSLPEQLWQRARRHKALTGLATTSLVVILGLISYGLNARLAAREQARLAQNLGQEIAKMEWLLRSARQLPLHDLGREKGVVRARMRELSQELGRGGSMTRGLSHYALGRGHLALHEYGEALKELRAALSEGVEAADVHYALGLVLGKHYEQAMYEARLSGGGEWAEKQLKELEPKYLRPAIESLQKSRAMKSDAPGYLEALIAYYQRDYEGALRAAEQAEREAPWLYEGWKLMGDVHVERALKARDSGKYEEAEKEFKAGVERYTQAAEIGRSDSEVYEGLAEAWVRQIEMDAGRGKSTEEAYKKAVEAGDRATASEPERVMGRLKKGYAALMTSITLGTGQSASERVKTCVAEMHGVLEKASENPYARDVAAGCYAFTADAAQGRGENPEPIIRKSIELLEPVLKTHPRFLWGLNDVAGFYLFLGMYLQLHGQDAKDLFAKTLQYEHAARALDASYLAAHANILLVQARLVSNGRSAADLAEILAQTDAAYQLCSDVNAQFQQCHINYLTAYARASDRLLLQGQDAGKTLERAREISAKIQKIGGQFLDAEQYTALTEIARSRLELSQGRDPTAFLKELDGTVKRCLTIAEKDAMCRSLSAQGEWVRADWERKQGRPWQGAMKEAVKKAKEATSSPEPYPDGWWTLAESHLRLLEEKGLSEVERAEHVAGVKEAVSKCQGINPNHALCHATQGMLKLWEAKRQAVVEERGKRAMEGVKSLEAALKSDPLLLSRYGSALTEAQNLARAP